MTLKKKQLTLRKHVKFYNCRKAKIYNLAQKIYQLTYNIYLQKNIINFDFIFLNKMKNYAITSIQLVKVNFFILFIYLQLV